MTIESVSPIIGSLNGGTDITITGTNFSLSTSDNNVFLTQSGESVRCFVKSCSET